MIVTYEKAHLLNVGGNVGHSYFHVILVACGLALPMFAHGIPVHAEEPSPRADSIPVNQSDWASVLKKYVVMEGPASRVNYRALKDDCAPLDRYLHSVENVSEQEFLAATEQQRLAFLINAYNALTVQLILDHYPVKSIRDIGGLISFLRNPWKIKFFKLFGKDHALDDIEQEMIRKKFNEPRIHFALVCASMGCPALRNEPYLPSRLNSQLEEGEKAFLGTQNKNSFDPSKKELHLSKIFDWYRADFEKNSESVKNFVAPFMAKTKEEAESILSPATKVTYLDYDWSLNGS